MSNHIGDNVVEPPPETRAILEHFRDALETGNVEAIADDYADDAVVVTQQGVVRGRYQIMRLYQEIGRHVLTDDLDLRMQAHPDGLVLFGWTGKAAEAATRDGVDTLIVRDGRIQTHATGFDVGPSD
jgi:ketosteroid isomerase-like protein